MTRSLYQIDKELHDLLRAIEYEHDGEITPEMSEQLDRLIDDKDVKLDNYGYFLLDLDGDIDKFKKEKARIEKRIKVLQNLQANLKKYLLYHMKYRDLETVESSGFKFTRCRSTPAVEFKPGSETFIPDKYKTIKLNIPLSDCPEALIEPDRVEVSKSLVADELKRAKAALIEAGKTAAEFTSAELRDFFKERNIDYNIYELATLRENYYMRIT